jgi:hypothetical protein
VFVMPTAPVADVGMDSRIGRVRRTGLTWRRRKRSRLEEPS